MSDTAKPKNPNDANGQEQPDDGRKVPDAAGAVAARGSVRDDAGQETPGTNGTAKKGKAKTGAEGNKIPSLDEQIEAKKNGDKSVNTQTKCFTGDTSVYTGDGYRPIKEIRKNDDIYSRDAATGETGLRKVKELIQSQAHTIYHIWLEDREEIKTTAYHPFYIKDKGWVNAIQLQEGDLTETMDGTARITKIFKERREEPVTVYNFHIHDWESYFVSKLRVFVHNMKCDLGDLEPCRKNIEECLAQSGRIEEDDKVLEDLAKLYAEAVYSDKPWSWKDTVCGEKRKLTKREKKLIREKAAELELLPKVNVTKDGDGNAIADFEGAGLVEYTLELPGNLWDAKDAEQFAYLDKLLKEKGIPTEGFTWHHSETPGVMQLIPLGVHNIIYHVGGRKLWTKGPRK